MLWLFRFRVSGFVAVTVMGCSGKAPCSVIHVSGRGVGFGRGLEFYTQVQLSNWKAAN